MHVVAQLNQCANIENHPNMVQNIVQYVHVCAGALRCTHITLCVCISGFASASSHYYSQAFRIEC